MLTERERAALLVDFEVGLAQLEPDIRTEIDLFRIPDLLNVETEIETEAVVEKFGASEEDAGGAALRKQRQLKN